MTEARHDARRNRGQESCSDPALANRDLWVADPLLFFPGGITYGDLINKGGLPLRLGLLVESVELMLIKGVKRLPVVDGTGCLAGMLSRLDVFRTVMHEAPDWNVFKAQKIERARRFF